MERQKLYSEKKLQKTEKTKKDMYSYTYTPKLNFKSVDIINEGVKQRLRTMDRNADGAVFVDSSKIQTSDFDGSNAFARKMSNDNLRPQLAYEYRNGRKYLRTASRGNLSVDSKNGKTSPAGTKHLRSRKDQDGVYDTNIYLDVNFNDGKSGLTDAERSKLTNSI